MYLAWVVTDTLNTAGKKLYKRTMMHTSKTVVA